MKNSQRLETVSDMEMRNADAVVIGGGAAGMMAAIEAGRRGKKIVVLEHEPFCGKKLRITGKGRCNVCNNCDIKTFLQNVPVNPKFLYSALNRFPPTDTMAFFEGLGVPLKTERGNRVFPVSDNAHDIAKALERAMRDAGVRVLHENAEEVLCEDSAVSGVKCSGGEIQCKSALIATGGVSYPLTGSTGGGLEMARRLGHTVTPLRPSLVPLVSDDPDCAEMQGFSLRNVTLTLRDRDHKPLYSELGEMMFTHFGVTGPLVLSASAHMHDAARAPYTIEIDLKPGLEEKKLDARILRDFEKYCNRDFSNALGDLAGRMMIPVLIRRSGIPPETKVNEITRAQRLGLVSLFKSFSIPISGTRPVAEAIVTSGGVSVREVDPRRMESKLIRGLYFAGEVLDVDAYTGGFNLQIAWSTGKLAGEYL